MRSGREILYFTLLSNQASQQIMLNIYRAKRNQVVKILRESKQTFFNQRLNNADTKTFWKTVRFLNRDYSSIPTLLDGDGTTTVESSSAKAACLNNVFYTCFNQNYPPLTEEVHVWFSRSK